MWGNRTEFNSGDNTGKFRDFVAPSEPGEDYQNTVEDGIDTPVC